MCAGGEGSHHSSLLVKRPSSRLKWRMKLIYKPALLLLFLLAAFPLLAQEEPHSFVGMTLSGLIGRFGPPDEVRAARGAEVWQDDVVFVYPAGEFYVYKDRVWQVSLAAAYGLSLGDPKPAALLVLGNEAVDMGNYLFYPLPAAAWPMTMRVIFSDAGIVTAIFVYRSDF